MTSANDHAAGPLEGASYWCLRLSESALSPAEQARFDAWLSADPTHRTAFEDAVGVWHGIGEASATEGFLQLRQGALQSFRRARSARGTRTWWAGGAMIAASLIAAIVVASLWRTYSWDTYATARGERRAVILADGSTLSLDASTKVRARYTDTRRSFYLDRGRARFVVAKDHRRPFLVTAGNKIVRATGTQFSVELLKDRISVVLYEGRVRVLTRQGGGLRAIAVAPGRPVEAVLTPGHELTLTQGDAIASIASADPTKTLSWETGQLVFENEPLATAVERIGRYTDKELALADAGVAGLRIDGVFNVGDPEAFVEAVSGVLPVDVRETPKGWTIASRARAGAAE